jgi:hypothetical protein
MVMTVVVLVLVFVDFVLVEVGVPTVTAVDFVVGSLIIIISVNVHMSSIIVLPKTKDLIDVKVGTTRIDFKNVCVNWD